MPRLSRISAAILLLVPLFSPIALFNLFLVPIISISFLLLHRLFSSAMIELTILGTISIFSLA